MLTPGQLGQTLPVAYGPPAIALMVGSPEKSQGDCPLTPRDVLLRLTRCWRGR